MSTTIETVIQDICNKHRDTEFIELMSVDGINEYDRYHLRIMNVVSIILPNMHQYKRSRLIDVLDTSTVFINGIPLCVSSLRTDSIIKDSTLNSKITKHTYKTILSDISIISVRTKPVQLLSLLRIAECTKSASIINNRLSY